MIPTIYSACFLIYSKSNTFNILQFYLNSPSHSVEHFFFQCTTLYEHVRYIYLKDLK